MRRGGPPPPSYSTTWSYPDGLVRRAMVAPFIDSDQKSYKPSGSGAISGGLRQSGKVQKWVHLEKPEKITDPDGMKERG